MNEFVVTKPKLKPEDLPRPLAERGAIDPLSSWM
jgi:hypothetical protein